jgi:cell envelope opacity-associated protein A
VYGIQDIRFAYTIATDEAVDLFRKNEIELSMIFEISKVEGAEKQNKK